MAAYANVKTKVFIHFANTNTEASDTGTLARDVKDYVTSLDSTTNKVISITHIVNHLIPKDGFTVVSVVKKHLRLSLLLIYS